MAELVSWPLLVGKVLAERMRTDFGRLKAENATSPVPVDLVTTSGSGLDPDISPDAAFFQAPRIATTRQLPETRVRDLISEHIEGRLLGFIGEPRVNVLALNLALDQMTP